MINFDSFIAEIVIKIVIVFDFNWHGRVKGFKVVEVTEINAKIQ